MEGFYWQEWGVGREGQEVICKRKEGAGQARSPSPGGRAGGCSMQIDSSIFFGDGKAQGQMTTRVARTFLTDHIPGGGRRCSQVRRWLRLGDSAAQNQPRFGPGFSDLQP